LKKQYAPLKVEIYPGHGQPTNALVFDADIKYINDLLMTVKSFKTQEEAIAAMKDKYPNWKGSDFILEQSIYKQFELSKNRQNGM
jgi:hypothetical protein